MELSVDDRQKFLKNIITLLRRASGMSIELNELSESMVKEILSTIDTSKSQIVIVKQLKSVIHKHFNNIETAIEDDLLTVAESSLATEHWLKPIPVTKTMVRDSLKIIMPSSNVSTLDLIKSTKGVTINSVVNYTTQAYQNGWTNIQLRDALRTTEKQLNRHLSTIARTSVNAVSNNAKMSLYKANSELVNRVLFSAHLDAKTSNICKSLDGAVFYLKDAPVLPLHPGERSQLVPVLKGENINKVRAQLNPRPSVEPKNKSIYEKKGLKTRTGKIRNPSRADISPLKGSTSNANNYEQWLKSQPIYYQEDILGKKAAKALRSGTSIKDAINLDPITRKQLNKAIKPRKVVPRKKIVLDNSSGSGTVATYVRPSDYALLSPNTKQYIDKVFTDKKYAKVVNATKGPGEFPSHSNNTCFYHNGAIHMTTGEHPTNARSRAIYRHEYGHFIDYDKKTRVAYANKTKTYVEEQISASPPFRKAFLEDRKLLLDSDNKLINKLKKEYKDHPDIKELSRNRGVYFLKLSELVKSMNRNLQTNGIRRAEYVNNTVKNPLVKEVAKFYGNRFNSLSDHEIARLIMADKYDYLEGVATFMRINQPGHLVREEYIGQGMDLIGAITNNVMGYGHSLEYYEKFRIGQFEYGNYTEAFANMFSLNQETETLGTFGKVFTKYMTPNLSKVFKEFIE